MFTISPASLVRAILCCGEFTRSPRLQISDLSMLTRVYMGVCELKKINRTDVDGEVENFNIALEDASNVPSA